MATNEAKVAKNGTSTLLIRSKVLLDFRRREPWMYKRMTAETCSE